MRKIYIVKSSDGNYQYPKTYVDKMYGPDKNKARTFGRLCEAQNSINFWTMMADRYGYRDFVPPPGLHVVEAEVSINELS